MKSPKRALVTGASSGIGKALVAELLDQKFEVLAISSSKERLAKIKEEMPSELLHIYPCDVSSSECVKQISLELQLKHKVPDLFFLNAGIAGESAMEPTNSLDIDIHKKLFAVNYFGVLNFVKEWLLPCKKKGGATFIVSNSVNAFFAPPGGSAYSASKAAISKAFDGLRIAHAGSNLNFLSVFCGPVDTPGLAGKLPFTWPAQKMAKHMIRKACAGKNKSHPSRFYSNISKLLNLCSPKLAAKICGHSSNQDDKSKPL